LKVDRHLASLRPSHVASAQDRQHEVGVDARKPVKALGFSAPEAFVSRRSSCSASRGGITSRDRSGYPILTMPEVPETFVTLLNRSAEKPLGAGEASQGPMAAAIANAFANATGHRLRDLPFIPERVQAALG